MSANRGGVDDIWEFVIRDTSNFLLCVLTYVRIKHVNFRETYKLFFNYTQVVVLSGKRVAVDHGSAVCWVHHLALSMTLISRVLTRKNTLKKHNEGSLVAVKVT